MPLAPILPATATTKPLVLEDVPMAPGHDDRVLSDDDAAWIARLRFYDPGGPWWVAYFGPRPEHPHCRVPFYILGPWRAHHGVDPVQ